MPSKQHFPPPLRSTTRTSLLSSSHHIAMLPSVLARATNANDLKDALDLSSTRTRGIAQRVAQSTVNGNGFALPIDPTTGQPTQTDQVDMEAEMTSLADEQIRYEATAKLLEKTYAQLRTAIK
jgi:flagellar basal body rod protein FlgB